VLWLGYDGSFVESGVLQEVLVVFVVMLYAQAMVGLSNQLIYKTLPYFCGCEGLSILRAKREQRCRRGNLFSIY
jgi:hypothetical protein